MVVGSSKIGLGVHTVTKLIQSVVPRSLRLISMDGVRPDTVLLEYCMRNLVWWGMEGVGEVFMRGGGGE